MHLIASLTQTNNFHKTNKGIEIEQDYQGYFLMSIYDLLLQLCSFLVIYLVVHGVQACCFNITQVERSACF